MTLLVTMLSVVLYPQHVYTPSRGDTALLTSSCWGAHTGAWLAWRGGVITDGEHQYSDHTLPMMVRNYLEFQIFHTDSLYFRSWWAHSDSLLDSWSWLLFTLSGSLFPSISVAFLLVAIWRLCHNKNFCSQTKGKYLLICSVRYHKSGKKNSSNNKIIFPRWPPSVWWDSPSPQWFLSFTDILGVTDQIIGRKHSPFHKQYFKLLCDMHSFIHCIEQILHFCNKTIFASISIKF